MFSVVSTVALLGLLALAIPLLIHLFNPGKGTLVWVGNIKLMQLAKKNAVTELRLTRWLLLLLRLLIIILITLLLAKTLFHGSNENTDKTLHLLTPQWVAQATDIQLQSLTALGDEIRVLAPGFAEFNPQNGFTEQPYSHWTLLSQLDKTRPANERFLLYSSDSLAGFDLSVKPEFSRDIQWHSLPDSANHVVDYQPNIAVYSAPSHAQQRVDLQAALAGIQAYRLPSLSVQWLSDSAPTAATANWIFWLSAKAVPDAIMQQVNLGAVLFKVSAKVSDNNLVRQLSGDGVIHQAENWASWVLQADFANQLLHRMTEQEPVTTRFIEPKMAASQMQGSKAPKGDDGGNPIPLQSILLLLLIVCWVLERTLAEWGTADGG
ncbi:MAG: hypothetical protein ACI8WB_002176 [Phenylobacterium sp.]|jgi:hypothetical protein